MTNELRLGSNVFVLPIVGFALLLTSSISFAAEQLAFDAKVTVVLQSSRKFTGHLDSRSNSQRLWMRFGDASTSVSRPIEWEQIVTARNAETSEMIPTADLRAAVVRLRGNAELVETPPKLTKSQISNFKSQISDSSRTFAPDAQHTVAIATAQTAARPIRGLYFDAQLDGWFGNTPEHGLTIVVRPFDDFFQTVPVNGTLEISLLAPQRRDFSAAPRSSGLVVQRIGHWQIQTRADQFGGDGLAVHLQLRSASTASLSSSIPYGLVHVRLTIPGVGVFEKTRDAVRLQPFSPILDLNQQQTRMPRRLAW